VLPSGEIPLHPDWRCPLTLLRAAALLLVAATALPGCMIVAGAAVGAGVVHATGDDTLEVVLHSPPGKVYDEALEVVRTRGAIEASRPAVREIDGSVSGASITVTVLPEQSGQSRLRVKARRNAGISPDLETAEQVASWILKRVT
jgi:hypothetical protein